MLSLGGRYLPIPTTEFSEWCARYIDPRDILQFDYTSHNHNLYHLSPPGDLELPPVRVGSIFWPSDASRFGVGYFLGDDSDVAYLNPLAITSSGVNGLHLVLDTKADPNDPTDANESVDLPVYMLPPRPLAQIIPDANDDYNGLWLITVVDRRYFWWFSRGNYTLDGSTTWNALYTQIAGDLVGVNAFTISETLIAENPSSRFTVKDQPIPPYLDAAAFYGGLRVALDKSGNLLIQSPADADPIAKENWEKVNGQDGPFYPMGGGQFNTDTVQRWVPKFVEVVFGKKNTDTGVYSETPYVTSVSLSSLSNLFEFNDISPEPFVGVTGFNGTKVLTGDPTALVTNASPTIPTNAADLDAYSDTLAAYWYEWQLGYHDVCLSGIAGWEPNANDGMIEWHYSKDMVCTRVQRSTWNDRTWGRFRRSDFGGERSWIIDPLASVTNTIVAEAYSPPSTPTDTGPFTASTLKFINGVVADLGGGLISVTMDSAGAISGAQPYRGLVSVNKQQMGAGTKVFYGFSVGEYYDDPATDVTYGWFGRSLENSAILLNGTDDSEANMASHVDFRINGTVSLYDSDNVAADHFDRALLTFDTSLVTGGYAAQLRFATTLAPSITPFWFVSPGTDFTILAPPDSNATFACSEVMVSSQFSVGTTYSTRQQGFTGTGAYTNFQIVGGIVISAT